MILRFASPEHANLTGNMVKLAAHLKGTVLDRYPLTPLDSAPRTCYAIVAPGETDPLNLMHLLRDFCLPACSLRLVFPEGPHETLIAYWPHVEGRA